MKWPVMESQGPSRTNERPSQAWKPAPTVTLECLSTTQVNQSKHQQCSKVWLSFHRICSLKDPVWHGNPCSRSFGQYSAGFFLSAVDRISRWTSSKSNTAYSGLELLTREDMRVNGGNRPRWMHPGEKREGKGVDLRVEISEVCIHSNILFKQGRDAVGSNVVKGQK